MYRFEKFYPISQRNAIELSACYITKQPEFDQLEKTLLNNDLLPQSDNNFRDSLLNLQNLDDINHLFAGITKLLIKNTVGNLTYKGIEKLNHKANYCFVGNHRDITLDAALLKYTLLHTLNIRFAVGNNLYKHPLFEQFLGLLQCFKVLRSQKSPKKLQAHLKELAYYVNFCLKSDDCSVWLAQGNGRAKDGNDRTDPAILKMLAINQKKQDFCSYMNSLNIVPVSISYEYDPCDINKAQELYTFSTTGKYEKAANEDFNSIYKGIFGYKGDVHIELGSVINGQFQNAAELAAVIDKQIIGNYKLHSSNYLAYQALYGELIGKSQITEQQFALFAERLETVPEHLRSLWLESYARPVLNRISAVKSACWK